MAKQNKIVEHPNMNEANARALFAMLPEIDDAFESIQRIRTQVYALAERNGVQVTTAT